MLRILGKRGDGFHELVTLFQAISLCDTLHFAADDEIGLSCDDPGVPVGDGNLIVRAGRMLAEYRDVAKGAKIHLEKRIPSPGGLGGGSSNAAAALVGLNRLWELNLSMDELHAIAGELGSDVPFFLYGGTAAAFGRGEIIEPAADRDESYLLVVTPDVSVPTGPAFAGLNAGSLTNELHDRILPVCRNDAESLDPRRSVLKNDFEESVFDAFPEIRRVKETLLGLGAVNAAMSGSGASVFAVFDNLETRQTAMKALDNESTWRKFAVATVSRAEYREALGLTS
jgi:4-diphosphocytidyl-2-C-methyl-D-erythritol kinase